MFLAAAVDYSFKSREEKVEQKYPKSSLRGAYKKVYKIVGRTLKSSSPDMLTPVYILQSHQSGEKMSGIFYETELKPATDAALSSEKKRK